MSHPPAGGSSTKLAQLDSLVPDHSLYRVRSSTRRMADKKEVISDTRTTTLFQGIFSLSKSAIGAGALALPHSIATLGLVPGLATILFASLTATIGLHFLSRLAANTDQSNYFALGRLAYGGVGELACMAALLLNLFGALVFFIVRGAGSFISFVTYVRPNMNPSDPLLVNVVTCITAAIIFPLAAQRDMSALAKTSIAGMICMGYILVLLVGDYLVELIGGRATTSINVFTSVKLSDFFTTFATTIFAFVNHFTMPPVVCNMVNPTPSRRAQVTFGSAALVLSYYIIFGLAGYLRMGSTVGRNILDSGTRSNSYIELGYVVGRLLMGVVLILSYPLLLDPCRSTIEGIISLIQGGASRPSSIRSLVITGALVGTSLFVALFCADLADDILSLFSGLSGSLLLFVFPSVFFLVLRSKYRVAFPERIAAYVNVAFGSIVMVGSTYYNAVNTFGKLFGGGKAIL